MWVFIRNFYTNSFLNSDGQTVSIKLPLTDTNRSNKFPPICTTDLSSDKRFYAALVGFSTGLPMHDGRAIFRTCHVTLSILAFLPSRALTDRPHGWSPATRRRTIDDGTGCRDERRRQGSCDRQRCWIRFAFTSSRGGAVR